MPTTRGQDNNKDDYNTYDPKATNKEDNAKAKAPLSKSKSKGKARANTSNTTFKTA